MIFVFFVCSSCDGKSVFLLLHFLPFLINVQVSNALRDEIKRLASLVDEFDRPFHPDPLVLSQYKKVRIVILRLSN